MNMPFWVYGKLNSYYRQQTKAKFLLSHGFISNHRFTELDLVARYLYNQDSSISLKKELIDYCRKWFKDFNEVKYNPAINTIVQNVKKKNISLVEIPSVSLPIESCKIMFNMIKKLSAPTSKKPIITKLLFTLVGLALLEKKRTNKTELESIYINHKYADMQKTAGISSANKLIELLQTLVGYNYVSVHISGSISLTPEFINKIKLYEHTTNIISVMDYDHLYKYSAIAFDMLHDRVPIYKPCALCNTLFTANRNVHKYCDRCSKLVKNYQNLQYYKKKKK